MSTFIKPAFQIQRINDLENRLAKIKEAVLEDLVRRPHAKSWSAIETAKHMVIGHNEYKAKVNTALGWNSTNNEIPSEFKASAIPSFLIKRFPPKDGIIRFKMKTAKKFKPVLDLENLDANRVQSILTELEGILSELRSWIEAYRTQPISLKKFNSAIGAAVRFTIPEACEFILCHNERHFLQLERALER